MFSDWATVGKPSFIQSNAEISSQHKKIIISEFPISQCIKVKNLNDFNFFSYFTYEGETCNAHSRPALEHLPLRWSKIDGKCSRKIALNLLSIPVMLNLTLALWENFDLVVRS